MEVPDKIHRRSIELRAEEPYATYYYYKAGPVDVLFRAPTWLEVYEFLSIVRPEILDKPLYYDSIALKAEEKLLGAVVKEPGLDQLLDQAPVVVNRLTCRVVEASGFLSENAISEGLDQARKSCAQAYENALIISICSAFPTIRPEEIDNWDLTRIIRHSVLAEIILGRRVFDPVHPQKPPAPPTQEQIAAMQMAKRYKKLERMASAFDTHEKARAPRQVPDMRRGREESPTEYKLPEFHNKAGSASVDMENSNKLLKKFGF